MFDQALELMKTHLSQVGFVLGGLFCGYIFEKLVLPVFANLVKKTKWEGDEIIVNALRGAAFVLFATLGLYAAIRSATFDSRYLELVHKGIIIIAILAITVVLTRIAVGFVNLYSRKVGGVLLSTSIFANLTGTVVFLIGALIVLQTLGISITPILTALGVGGLAVALALQDTLSNMFSGIQVIASRQLRLGDYVKLGSGEEGYITDITWRYTTIRALPNNLIIVPNAKLASALVTNYAFPEKELSVLVDVGVSYESDLKKVEEVTIDVARSVMREIEGGVPEFDPFIRYHTFADFSINFTVILRAREYVDKYLVRHEFIKRLHRRYNEDGIEIPFPIRTVHMKN
jgi:small-conductance mechanosensitive channel